MIKEHFKLFKRLLIVADIMIALLALLLSRLLRNSFYPPSEPLASFLWLSPLFCAVWSIFLYHFGMYASFRTRGITEILVITIKTAVVSFITFSSLIFVFKVPYASRSLILLGFFLTAFLIFMCKAAMVFFFRYARSKGFNYRNILIVGTGKRAQYFMDLVRRHSEWGLHILGLVDDDSEKVGQEIDGSKVIGCLNDIPDIVHSNVVDEVVFVVPRSWLGKIEEMMHFCESEGIKINVAVNLFELKFTKAKQTDLHGLPLLTFESAPDRLWHLLLKRLFDIVVSGVGLVIFSPLLALIALSVKVTSRGPVFFKQKRCGFNGRTFMLFKFRTMGVDAEKKLKGLLEHNEMQGPTFKMANDPRLTKIGKFLRKTSLDELPQLWNVFKGEMSLVGPRPPIPTEVEQYLPWQRRRLTMRPGITCLWQVKGRNKIVDFNEWMRLDLEYIDNWSLGLDMRIFTKTIPVVMFGIGAK
ncbi:MAG: sugar transferase [Candidatus Omnitrophota bacterium]